MALITSEERKAARAVPDYHRLEAPRPAAHQPRRGEGELAAAALVQFGVSVVRVLPAGAHDPDEDRRWPTGAPMHEAVMEIKTNIDCVEIIEAENVPDEAGATTTMENMIQQGAKLIFATAFNHHYPALELSNKFPDVKFEHAGGWEMGPNFANFFGTPPDGWYMMGVAAGKMTTSNKLGFVAAFPLGWTNTFINAFTLGAKSVNPDVQTIVAYTFAWGDRAKEADTTNSLINQGVDVITMHVDSPSTVISTAESRGVYSVGYQNLAAQQFAPEYWISGTGFTLGGKLTWLASTVLDGTWEAIFLRCGIADGCGLCSERMGFPPGRT